MPLSERIKGSELGFIGNKARKYFCWRTCIECHTARLVRVDSFRQHCRSCSKRLSLVDQRGEKNPYWKGGQTYHLGYRLIRIDASSPYFAMARKNGYVLEHRLIKAVQIGRCLAKHEKVHHINGKKLLNTPLNLELLEHQQAHKLSYAAAYQDGFQAGNELKIKDLQSNIRLLRFQMRELQMQLQPQLKEGAN